MAESESGPEETGGRHKNYESPLLQELGSVKDFVKDINVSIVVQ